MAHYFIANHDKQFIAIASPKCASTAVRSWFLQTAGVDHSNREGVGRYGFEVDRSIRGDRAGDGDAAETCALDGQAGSGKRQVEQLRVAASIEAQRPGKRTLHTEANEGRDFGEVAGVDGVFSDFPAAAAAAQL